MIVLWSSRENDFVHVVMQCLNEVAFWILLKLSYKAYIVWKLFIRIHERYNKITIQRNDMIIKVSESNLAIIYELLFYYIINIY